MNGKRSIRFSLPDETWQIMEQVRGSKSVESFINVAILSYSIERIRQNQIERQNAAKVAGCQG